MKEYMTRERIWLTFVHSGCLPRIDHGLFRDWIDQPTFQLHSVKLAVKISIQTKATSGESFDRHVAGVMSNDVFLATNPRAVIAS